VVYGRKAEDNLFKVLNLGHVQNWSSLKIEWNLRRQMCIMSDINTKLLNTASRAMY